MVGLAVAITALRLLRGCRRAARRSIAGDGWCRSCRQGDGVIGHRVPSPASALGLEIGARDGKLYRCFPRSGIVAMNRAQSNEPDQAVSSTVSITVLSVTPARAKKLFAFASVEIDIDGVQIGVHGIRAMREDGGTAIDLPNFRDAAGVCRAAITLPEDVTS